MSSSIWTDCAGASRVAPLRLTALRAVEAQHGAGTRKLVDSADDQALLEDLIDAAKPPRPAGSEFRGLHYLLETPFRYPPLPHGSRFGERGERGLWYGALEARTAFAEAAYYRLVFLEGTTARLEPLTAELTTFEVPVRTALGIDLTRAPFDAHAARISSPTSYAASRALGRAMRAAGVEAFGYRSARDAEHGTNVALFSPRAFGSTRPARLKTWLATSARDAVEIARRDPFGREVHRFARAQFLVAGKLPHPAI